MYLRDVVHEVLRGEEFSVVVLDFPSLLNRAMRLSRFRDLARNSAHTIGLRAYVTKYQKLGLLGRECSRSQAARPVVTAFDAVQPVKESWTSGT